MLKDRKIINTTKGLGCIYVDEVKKGVLCIDGEYVCDLPYLSFGYSISSKLMDVWSVSDKDLVLKATSKLWRYSGCVDTVVCLIREGVEDVKYVHTVSYNVKTYKDYEMEKDTQDLLNIK